MDIGRFFPRVSGQFAHGVLAGFQGPFLEEIEDGHQLNPFLGQFFQDGIGVFDAPGKFL